MTTIKYYVLTKNFNKKYFNNIEEFCFDDYTYWILEKFFLMENRIMRLEVENERRKGRELRIYYIQEGYRSDIIGGHRIWLIKDELVEKLKERLGEDRLRKQIEIFPVKLLPERYAIKDKEIMKKLINGEKIGGMIEGYNIINVLNRFDQYEFKNRYKEIHKEVDFFILKERWRYVHFSEKVKSILEGSDLGIYDIMLAFEG